MCWICDAKRFDQHSRAFQNRAKKRKRRRILAKAQRKHLVAIKGKRKVGKMLAYNRRERNR